MANSSPDLRSLSSLASLSDEDLLAGLREVVFDSQRLLARLIAFLAEVDLRELWAKHASSLFDFCVRCLGFAEDAAYRRMTVVRLARRFPEIVGRIERGELHLSALLLLNPHITRENHQALLDMATGKTKRQIEIGLAKLFPRPDVEDSMRPARPDEQDVVMEPLSPDRFRFEFTASSALCDKIQRARDLTSHANPRGDLSVVLERALDLLLPKLEYERFGKTKKPRDEAPQSAAVIAVGEGIPAAVKHAVAERDEYRCTFCGDDGQRCPSTRFLELDHITPKALGGENTVENLRLRCRAHNKLAAVEVFGREHVERKIKERQDKRARTNFDSVASALARMGFKKKETVEAVETVGPAMDPSAQCSFEAVFREAIAFLTPTPPRQPPTPSAPGPQKTSRPSDAETRAGADRDLSAATAQETHTFEASSGEVPTTSQPDSGATAPPP